MKFSVAVLLFVIFSGFANAQQISYEQWQTEAANDIRLLPKYGGQQKTQEMIQADQKFVEVALKELGTARKASDYVVKLGFDYLAKGDPKTAIYRFNQAWMLDPTNENAFWGFGGLYFYFKDHGKALQNYTEGLVINPKSSNIMIDMASISLARYQTNKDASELTSAINLLGKAYEIDPQNQSLLSKLSICYFFTNDCANAIKYYEECVKLGGKTLSPGYAEALKAKCKN